MREAPVLPETTVVDAETKSNGVRVRNNGANDPNPLCGAGPVETRSDTQGCHGM
jgi:hypothetical protein